MANKNDNQTYRVLDYGALVRQVEGPPKPVVVYRFRNREFIQRPGHNPFKQTGNG